MKNLLLQFLKFSLIALTAYGIIYLTKRNTKKQEKKMTVNKFTIKYHQLYVVSGILLSLLFITLTIFSFFSRSETTLHQTSTLWVQLTFTALALLGLVFTYTSIRFKIHIDNNRIIVIPLFSSKKIYSFNQIVRVSYKKGLLSQLTVFVDNKKAFSISEELIGFNLLLNRLEDHLPRH